MGVWLPVEGLPTIQEPFGCAEIYGRHCKVWMVRRPHYCDRGRFLAHVELLPGAKPTDLWLDGADNWPRYYFDLKRAQDEVEAWMRARSQWIE